MKDQSHDAKVIAESTMLSLNDAERALSFYGDIDLFWKAHSVWAPSGIWLPPSAVRAIESKPGAVA